jgi:hypothetical protein
LRKAVEEDLLSGFVERIGHDDGGATRIEGNFCGIEEGFDTSRKNLAGV